MKSVFTFSFLNISVSLSLIGSYAPIYELLIAIPNVMIDTGQLSLLLGITFPCKIGLGQAQTGWLLIDMLIPWPTTDAKMLYWLLGEDLPRLSLFTSASIRLDVTSVFSDEILNKCLVTSAA